MHILVVDDDIPTVEVIRTSLHWDLLGIDRVETAYDYTEAQNKICASQPDIILCDIEMPRGSGLDLLRQVRAAVLEELNQDYVMGARARGFSESHILWKEVLPNALLPLVTLLGLAFGSLLGGAAVVEIVFSWPGLGYMVVEAITYRDFQTVQAIVLWIAFMYMVINLVVDLSYRHLDPRLRKGGR